MAEHPPILRKKHLQVSTSSGSVRVFRDGLRRCRWFYASLNPPCVAGRLTASGPVGVRGRSGARSDELAWATGPSEHSKPGCPGPIC